jgi:hypothetical protein
VKYPPAPSAAPSGSSRPCDNVFAPVLADFLQEARSANARLTDQLEYLKRLVVLLNTRTRGNAERENRVLLNRVRNLEWQVSELRQKMKVTS